MKYGVFVCFLTFLICTQAMSQGEQQYLIGENDRIHVFIWEHDELSREYVVDPDGGVDFNLVGYVEVAGRTSSAVSVLLTEKYKRYFQNPVVNVTLSGFQGARVSVIGEVFQPGTYPLTKGFKLSKCLSLAAGPRENADLKNVKVLRRCEGEGEGVIHIAVDMQVLIEDGMVEHDLDAKDGDIIYIPQKRFSWMEYRWMVLATSATLSLLFLIIRQI